MIRNFREKNILVTMLVVASALIFSLNAIAEKPKMKVSIKDSECDFLAPSPEDYKRLSKNQRLLFDESLKLLETHDLSKAAEKLQKITVQAKSFVAEYDLGLIYAEQGDLEKAELALKRANKIYQWHRESYKILSKVQKALGKEEEAESSMVYYMSL